jgi:hypothetical protein
VKVALVATTGIASRYREKTGQDMYDRGRAMTGVIVCVNSHELCALLSTKTVGLLENPFSEASTTAEVQNRPENLV